MSDFGTISDKWVKFKNFPFASCEANATAGMFCCEGGKCPLDCARTGVPLLSLGKESEYTSALVYSPKGHGLLNLNDHIKMYHEYMPTIIDVDPIIPVLVAALKGNDGSQCDLPFVERFISDMLLSYAKSVRQIAVTTWPIWKYLDNKDYVVYLNLQYWEASYRSPDIWVEKLAPELAENMRKYADRFVCGTAAAVYMMVHLDTRDMKGWTIARSPDIYNVVRLCYRTKLVPCYKVTRGKKAKNGRLESVHVLHKVLSLVKPIVFEHKATGETYSYILPDIYEVYYHRLMDTDKQEFKDLLRGMGAYNGVRLVHRGLVKYI
jgi:hypothetical protein